MLKKLIASVSLLCAASFANASVMESTQTITLKKTDFAETLVFDKFDDEGGLKVLESVFISYEGVLEGTAAFENTGPNATTIGVVLVADFLLQGPIGINLASSINEQAASVALTGYDNVLDFAGSSGFSDSYIASAGNSSLFTDPIVFAFFNGPGSFDLTFSTDANSFATGAGNAASQFSTAAGADVTVSYRFTTAEMQVSAPASLAFVGLALLAVARLRRA